MALERVGRTAVLGSRCPASRPPGGRLRETLDTAGGVPAASVVRRARSGCCIGPVSGTRGRLDFDPKTERFKDCEEANRLLDKEYRQPFGLQENL